jgi:hypothetical protein
MPPTPAETEAQALRVGLVVVHGQILRAAERVSHGERQAVEELRYLAAHLVLLSLTICERSAQNPS